MQRREERGHRVGFARQEQVQPLARHEHRPSQAQRFRAGMQRGGELGWRLDGREVVGGDVGDQSGKR